MQVDLFSVTAPLLVRLPNGVKGVAAELYAHPEGGLMFNLFWHLAMSAEAFHLLTGELRGAGPWKVGDSVITVMGCHHTEPEVAGDYAAWQSCLQEPPDQYPAAGIRSAIARAHGADC